MGDPRGWGDDPASFERVLSPRTEQRPYPIPRSNSRPGSKTSAAGGSRPMPRANENVDRTTAFRSPTTIGGA